MEKPKYPDEKESGNRCSNKPLFIRYYNSWIEVTTCKDNQGELDTSVTDSSNMTDFTTSKVNKLNDDDGDDSLVSFVPKVAGNADWSFSFK